MKRSFFQAEVVSILQYGCTIWTLTKRLEKKLDGNFTRMLRAILNKSWRQHPREHQLYGHLLPITKTIQVRWTRHAGHCWRSRDQHISDVLQWAPTYGRAKAGRSARTYIQQLCEDTGYSPKTCQRRWTIERSGEIGSGISVLAASRDDDDDDDDDMFLNRPPYTPYHVCHCIYLCKVPQFAMLSTVSSILPHCPYSRDNLYFLFLVLAFIEISK